MNTLEVRNLCKVYPAFTLQDVSFSVPAGSVTGLVGRNGAGKSTTLKSLLGLVHPDGGEVRFCGMDTAENEKAFKEEIGVVLGGIDFYPKKKLKIITAVTKKFYVNWDEEAYRRYMALFALDEQKRVDQLSITGSSFRPPRQRVKAAAHIPVRRAAKAEHLPPQPSAAEGPATTADCSRSATTVPARHHR